MLVTLNDVLPLAAKEKRAVGLFNTVTPEMAKGVLRAAEEMETSVIIGTAEVLLPYASLEDLAGFLVPMAKQASVPVVLHFDHGLSAPLVKRALALGFSSVMYDCSSLPYAENLQKVAEMAAYAHNKGASIEAELGHVGANQGSSEGEGEASVYTNPAQAAEFAGATGVDALAIAFGTAHGAYKTRPVLNMEIVQQIHSLIPTPLVMHGGSGLSPAEFKESIRAGISKINIFTDIDNAAARAAYAGFKEGAGFTSLMHPIAKAVYGAAKEKISLFCL